MLGVVRVRAAQGGGAREYQATSSDANAAGCVLWEREAPRDSTHGH